MENLLSDLVGITVFFDDIRIQGRTQAEHDERLVAVLSRLRNAGLTLCLNKCEINKSKIKFLGYEIDKNGVHISADKIAAIRRIPSPTCVKELQIFLGMLNYYSKFIKKFSDIMSPLYKLLNKDSKWKWTRECETAFLKAKSALESYDVLMLYSTELPVKITCDASPTGVGAVLSHTLEDGSVRPIAYASKTLAKAERNYSQFDREALAIVFGVKEFHQYVYGRFFTIETDHKPLTYVFGEGKSLPQMAASRVQRWSVFLSGYNYSMKYIKVRDNCNADCLSRLNSDSSSTNLIDESFDE